MDKNILLQNEELTRALAKKLGESLRGGGTVALVGDLGVGKTAFTKGIAVGLGIEDPILSPTFTIVREYSGRLRLYHFDMYRIDDEDALFEIGFEEYLQNPDGVCIIEWADRIASLLPAETMWLRLSYIDESKRMLSLHCPEDMREQMENIFA